MAPDKAREKNVSDESNAEESEEITSDISEEDNRDPDKFYRESTAKIIKAVKQSGILQKDSLDNGAFNQTNKQT